MKKKKEISWDDAIFMLKKNISNSSYGDFLYDIAHDLFMEAVNEIEREYRICRPEYAERDEEWYDRDRDEGVDYIMERMTNPMWRGQLN